MFDTQRNELALEQRRKWQRVALGRVDHDQYMRQCAILQRNYPFVGIAPIIAGPHRYYMLNLGDDLVTGSLFWYGGWGYESFSAALFSGLSKNARLIMDLGAFTGYYSLLAGLYAPKGTPIIAVEANPYNYCRLAINARLNGSRIVPLHRAIVPNSSSVRQVEIYYDETLELDTGSCLKIDEAELIKQKMKKIASHFVNATRVGAVMPSDCTDDGTCLIKLDIEGLEVPIVKDLLNIQELTCRAILVELITPTSRSATLKLATQNGMRMYFVDDFAAELIPFTSEDTPRTRGSRNYILCDPAIESDLVELSTNTLEQLGVERQ